MELKLVPQTALSQKQNQLLMMLPKMQQAIAFLQAPIMELSALLKEEMQRNPLLEEEENDDDDEIAQLVDAEKEQELDVDRQENEEVRFDDDDFEVMKKLDEEYRDHFAQSGDGFAQVVDEERVKQFLENSLKKSETLYEFLMAQASENLENEKDQILAQQIIGNLDQNGFLGVALSEIALLLNEPIQRVEQMLTLIQTFDPPGVGALDVRTSLMLQLKRKGMEKTLAYRIIENQFDDLLHNRIPVIARSLNSTFKEVEDAIFYQIAKLDLKPGSLFYLPYTPYIVPDAIFDETNGEFTIIINQEGLPNLRINRRYLRLMDQSDTSEETKNFIRMHLQSAKYLMHNIFQRNQTLNRVLECLLAKQKEYLSSQEGELFPLLLKEVAQELELHESTIARAVANKYILTPRGMLPMRRFFSNSLSTDTGEEKSTDAVREQIKKMIEEEDKCRPLSDEKMMVLLKERGIICARRTVAKYRRMLEYGNAHQRRKYTR